MFKCSLQFISNTKISFFSVWYFPMFSYKFWCNLTCKNDDCLFNCQYNGYWHRSFLFVCLFFFCKIKWGILLITLTRWENIIEKNYVCFQWATTWHRLMFRIWTHDLNIFLNIWVIWNAVMPFAIGNKDLIHLVNGDGALRLTVIILNISYKLWYFNHIQSELY